MRTILTTFLLLVYSAVAGQTFQRTFHGWWASTSWTFEFNSDGSYSRVSSGHYGHTTVSGKYIINGDTILLRTGFKETHGTVNEKYLIDNDTIIIDLYLRYDYHQKGIAQNTYYQSKKREIKYPQTQSIYYDMKSELETVLNMAFNSDEIKRFYHFNEFPDRGLLIAKYHYLDADINVDSRRAVYKSKADIDEKFYIEYKDINLNENSIDIQMEVHGEGVQVWFYYKKIDGKWTALKPHIIKN